MARYINLEDPMVYVGGYTPDGHTVFHVPSNTPTADVVEVVRCKECRFYNEDEMMCSDTYGFDRWWKPTDFCSHGVRREDE